MENIAYTYLDWPNNEQSGPSSINKKCQFATMWTERNSTKQLDVESDFESAVIDDDRCQDNLSYPTFYL